MPIAVHVLLNDPQNNSSLEDSILAEQPAVTENNQNDLLGSQESGSVVRTDANCSLGCSRNPPTIVTEFDSLQTDRIGHRLPAEKEEQAAPVISTQAVIHVL